MTEKNTIKTSSPDFMCVVTSGILSIKSYHLDEIKLIGKGIKAEGILELATSLNLDIDCMAKVLGTTKRSLSHCKNKRLNPKISENAIEVAKLSQFGVEYFQSIEEWSRWLSTANLRFMGRQPLSFMGSIRGRYLIKSVIQKQRYGFTA